MPFKFKCFDQIRHLLGPIFGFSPRWWRYACTGLKLERLSFHICTYFTDEIFVVNHLYFWTEKHMMFQYMAKRSYKQQLSSEKHRHTDSLSFFQTPKSFVILLDVRCNSIFCTAPCDHSLTSSTNSLLTYYTTLVTSSSTTTSMTTSNFFVCFRCKLSLNLHWTPWPTYWTSSTTLLTSLSTTSATTTSMNTCNLTFLTLPWWHFKKD